MRRVAIIFGVVGLLMSWAGVWVVGVYFGGHKERYKRYLTERDQIAPVLTSDSRFANVGVVEDTANGGICLWGAVKGEAAFDRLKAELVRLFGEARANELLSGGMIYYQREVQVR